MPPRVSADLEWREVEPGHWILFKDGQPFKDDLDDGDFADES